MVRETGQRGMSCGPVRNNDDLPLVGLRPYSAECDAVGPLTRRWQVIASGGLLAATICRDAIFPIGNYLTNVPRWSARFWNSYT
jgi:hypothetical protein